MKRKSHTAETLGQGSAVPGKDGHHRFAKVVFSGAACRAVGRAWSAPLRWGRRGGLVVLFGILMASTLLTAGANPVHPVLAQFAPDLRPANPVVSPVPPYVGDVADVTVTVVTVGHTAALSETAELVVSR